MGKSDKPLQRLDLKFFKPKIFFVESQNVFVEILIFYAQSSTMDVI